MRCPVAEPSEKLEPLFNQVLLKRLKNERTTGSGLIVVEGKNEGSWLAEVLAKGPGIFEPGPVASERHRPVTCVDTGDQVYVPAFSGYVAMIDGVEYLLVKDTEILAKVRRGG
jgi:chaperonin GroES